MFYWISNQTTKQYQVKIFTAEVNEFSLKESRSIAIRLNKIASQLIKAIDKQE